jgi:hypothetical protein
MKAKQGLLTVMVLLIGGAAAAGAAAAYYWHRATALPTWYTASTLENDLATTVNSNQPLLETKLATGDGVEYTNDQQVTITLTEPEFNQLIQERLSQSPSLAPMVNASQGIKATIAGDRLQAGMVINPSQIPLDHLPPDADQKVKDTLEALPLLGDRDLYVGITGSPRVENGRLILGEDIRIQIGNVKLSMAEVARLTGLSTDQLTEQINIALPQTGLTLDGLEFINDQMILRGVTEQNL